MVAAMVTLNEASEDHSQRRRSGCSPQIKIIWDMLDEVKDPEIPVLSIWDLGILRDVEQINSRLVITITPTYSGCPAMETIRNDIKTVLTGSGYPDCEVRTVLSPAWTTDWISEEGKEKLQQFGIAPPGNIKSEEQLIVCPRCKSEHTRLISEFGSTACKAMYQCDRCQEPFCYFKAI